MQKQRKKPRRNLKELKKKLEIRTNFRYQRIFEAVFIPFQRAISLSGSIPALNPKRGSESNRSESSGQVKASRSDFIADVELCAKKVLTRRERDIFAQLIVLHYLPERQEVFIIAEKMGQEFERRGIFPLKAYFQSKHEIPPRNYNVSQATLRLKPECF